MTNKTNYKKLWELEQSRSKKIKDEYESEGFHIIKSKKGTIPISNVNVECYLMEK